VNGDREAIPVLRTEDLTIAFGGLRAVDGVNLEIEKGLTSVIGPNGAGKTTLFNLLTGLYKPTAGRIFFGALEITSMPVHKIVKLGISRSFQILKIFADMSVFENIRVAVQAQMGHGMEFFVSPSRLSGVTKRAEEILEGIGLAPKARLKAKNLSYGDKRILEIGLSLAGNPQVLLLDEPTCGVGTHERAGVARFIRDLTKKWTILLVEHDMDIVMGISDRIVVMQQGRIIADGAPGEIKNNETVREVYLGR
jgi:branched-chain amino acid transport system ATP-binding protein